MTGIISAPIEGAQREGGVGFLKGMGKGLAGAIVTGLPDEEEKYAEASTVVRTALDFERGFRFAYFQLQLIDPVGPLFAEFIQVAFSSFCY